MANLPIVISVLLLVAGSGLSGAEAATQRVPSSRSVPAPAPEAYPDTLFGFQGGRYCRRLCVEDESPCDPVHFKTADGRCAHPRD